MNNNGWSFICGLLFGSGLIVSGMTYPGVILSGLSFGMARFTPDLIITFVSALIVTSIIYQIAFKKEKPLCADIRQLPVKDKIDLPLILGSALFGMGWGMTGLCPGPNIVGLAFWAYPFYWMSFLGIFIGVIISKILVHRYI